ncbi:hypothetical protein GCK72_011832 [Caenorhabditis remanei]|uniref:Ubiquitin-like protease family profile domain-containing protein n=1 Tax=Caenorhabditis remanei TaxID=31234 RepID=A0A6A5H9M4_CAERE|nr:hypothetical protein GCK72_011832 [Caenorhabditis remanei]KAF1763566.1 hypothetical protein GCK72_011832 [Caenorhabditis remanei]
MRRGKESDDVDDDEKKREESEEERKATGGSELEDGVKFGEQLQDDLINTFCDKLQKACPRTLDAFMAIQFLMITDEKDIRRLVTGTNPALQVLYDRTRSHYVLVYYNPKYNKVFLFDSLQPYDSAETPQILNEMVFYISRLFGHLFTKHIPVIVDKEFQRQSDNFSCGYRVIGALVDLTRGRNPCTQDYSRTLILNFLRFILAEPEPTWEMFESAEFACKKPYSGQNRVSIYIQNTTYVGTPSTSRSSSTGKQSSSDDSLASQKSEQSSNGGRGRKTGRRAHAGYYNPHLENYRANSERYTRSIPPRNLYPYRPSSPLSAPYFQAPPTSWRSPTALGPPPPVDNTLISCIRNFANQSIFNGHIFRRKSDRFELENDVEKGLGVVEKREEE